MQEEVCANLPSLSPKITNEICMPTDFTNQGAVMKYFVLTSLNISSLVRWQIMLDVFVTNLVLVIYWLVGNFLIKMWDKKMGNELTLGRMWQVKRSG